MNEKEIRALYDDRSIIVYQAYNYEIAHSAVVLQTFVSPPFKIERMTWIKPSFLWMMYRSGWATKENQEHILAVKISREGFEWALKNACLSSFDSSLHQSYDSWKTMLAESPVRLQWDPERDIQLNPLNYRAIQIGLTGIAVHAFIKEWIISIDDITSTCKKIHELLIDGKTTQAKSLLPSENIYPSQLYN